LGGQIRQSDPAARLGAQVRQSDRAIGSTAHPSPPRGPGRADSEAPADAVAGGSDGWIGQPDQAVGSGGGSGGQTWQSARAARPGSQIRRFDWAIRSGSQIGNRLGHAHPSPPRGPGRAASEAPADTVAGGSDGWIGQPDQAVRSGGWLGQSGRAVRTDRTASPSIGSGSRVGRADRTIGSGSQVGSGDQIGRPDRQPGQAARLGGWIGAGQVVFDVRLR
jgi:hypothetical protein